MPARRIISALIVVVGTCAAALVNGGFPWGP
jgi:hypothetical protein